MHCGGLPIRLRGQGPYEAKSLRGDLSSARIRRLPRNDPFKEAENAASASMVDWMTSF